MSVAGARSDDTDRDARLTALYRAAAAEQPAPALDDAIRAAARRAVGSKPRQAGLPFVRTWQVPLSIAAVVVLSVSLVTLMREEAPELTQPPRADSSGPSVASVPESEPGGQTPSKTQADTPTAPATSELKPSQAPSSSDLAMRRNAEPAATGKLRKETTDRLQPAPSVAPPPEAFPNSPATRDNKIAAPVEQSRKLDADEARRDKAGAAEMQRYGQGAVLPRRELDEAAKARREADEAAKARQGADDATKAKRGSESAAEAQSPAASTGALAQPKTQSLASQAERARAPQREPAATANSAPAPADDAVRGKQETTGVAGALMREPERTQVPPQAKPAPPPAPKPRPYIVEEKRATQTPDEIRAYSNLPPEQWLVRIEELRKRGRLEDARKSLAEFRQRYPDYVLPASLKDVISP